MECILGLSPGPEHSTEYHTSMVRIGPTPHYKCLCLLCSTGTGMGNERREGKKQNISSCFFLFFPTTESDMLGTGSCVIENISVMCPEL